MNKKERSRPATYRELRQTLSRVLPREAFDLVIEEIGAVERIASLWSVNLLWQWHRAVEKGSGNPPTPEDFNRIRGGEDLVKQRLRDRLYYAAVLAVMEAEPAGLGQEVPVSYVEGCEKLTAILGRKNEWLPRKGRHPGAKTTRTSAADADREEARRNQVLDAIGELDPVKKKGVAQKIGITDRQLRRWIEMYEWDWDVMEFEGMRKKRT